MGSVRAAMERMGHTFGMARARNDLRLAIQSMRRGDDTDGAQNVGTDTIDPLGTQV